MKEVAIVGLPLSGKSTVWGAVARTQAAPAGSPEPGVAIVEVPDGRLERVGELRNSAKLSPARVQLVDVPGLDARALASAREADALAIVLRAFGEDADPRRDLAFFRAELAVADLGTVERAHERVAGKARAGDKEAAKQADLFSRAEDVLSDGRWLSEADWVPDEAHALRLLTPLTLKPVLHVVNADEAGADVQDLPEPSMVVRGLLELEASELGEEDAEALLAEFGVTESATARFVHAVYDTLDLVRFYTANEKEARAWEVPRGTKAPQAAGTIHADFEKGFVRAEAVDFDVFARVGSWDAAREVGELRVEGKDYEVQDGDLLRIRHT